MCGIVGYIGPYQAIDFLIEGMRRLEYRGYDSSGVVTIDDGELEITKSAGRVDDLVDKLKTHSARVISASGIRAGQRTARQPISTLTRISAEIMS